MPTGVVTRRVSVFSLMFDPRNWPVWIVVLTCAAVFAGQQRGLVPLDTYAFSAQALKDGRWWTPLTSIFMHGDGVNPFISYAHIGMNMWAYLSLAPLVAARFGKGWRGLVPFHIFYLLIGLAGVAVFWAFHRDSGVPLVGASGAIYGVYAAVMRLDIFADRVAPVFSRRTLEAVWFFIWSNAVVIVLFGGPYLLLQVLSGQAPSLDVPIAWEAHLGGFVAGFVLIGLMKGQGWDRDWKAGVEVIRF
ncbi:rhomboid family intramembrane serine protease [Asticcacaulis sp. BE141]|nr:rhomboid family intramembrane serine protease [Asticcacaulis sp. BE141]MBP2158445.1 membrane associated rhomboid family serine protease [Asticcacaulis solisilvae]MDR6799490.1 membrane associated rhomboid family serine protease [Asticcacaulis sp. BE141]